MHGSFTSGGDKKGVVDFGGEIRCVIDHAGRGWGNKGVLGSLKAGLEPLTEAFDVEFVGV